MAPEPTGSTCTNVSAVRDWSAGTRSSVGSNHLGWVGGGVGSSLALSLPDRRERSAADSPETCEETLGA